MKTSVYVESSSLCTGSAKRYNTFYPTFSRALSLQSLRHQQRECMAQYRRSNPRMTKGPSSKTNPVANRNMLLIITDILDCRAESGGK